jgi:predicted nucleotidyltransferase
MREAGPEVPPGVARALSRFRAALDGRFGKRLRELVLYGSYARGEATEDSDVDVLVVVRGLTDEERREVFDLAYDANAAEREIWAGLSPLVHSEQQALELRSRERLLYQEIDHDKVTV